VALAAQAEHKVVFTLQEALGVHMEAVVVVDHLMFIKEALVVLVQFASSGPETHVHSQQLAQEINNEPVHTSSKRTNNWKSCF
jgi:hypothetical protein